MTKRCRFSRRRLVHYFLGEMEGQAAAAMANHLKDCSICKGELRRLQAIVQTAEEIRQDLNKEAEVVDWDAFNRQMEQKFQEIEFFREYQLPLPGKRFFWPWRLAAAGVAAGLLLGLAISFYFFRPRPTLESPFYQVPTPFLEKVDEEMARRAILDYLEKSRMVLLSVRQSSEQPQQADLILPQQKRIRQLLNEKKYLAPQMETFRLSKAKAILDEIDGLLLELALVQEGSSSQETKEISRLIEERRLLLKIQLLRQELGESEGKT